MTKTEAKRIARQAREHGYFMGTRYPDIWVQGVTVKCPLCRELVEGFIKLTGATRGETAEALDNAMIDHLTYDHEEN